MCVENADVLKSILSLPLEKRGDVDVSCELVMLHIEVDILRIDDAAVLNFHNAEMMSIGPSLPGRFVFCI